MSVRKVLKMTFRLPSDMAQLRSETVELLRDMVQLCVDMMDVIGGPTGRLSEEVVTLVLPFERDHSSLL